MTAGAVSAVLAAILIAVAIALLTTRRGRRRTEVAIARSAELGSLRGHAQPATLAIASADKRFIVLGDVGSAAGPRDLTDDAALRAELADVFALPLLSSRGGEPKIPRGCGFVRPDPGLLDITASTRQSPLDSKEY